MEALKIYLNNLIKTSRGKNVLFRRNLLKEYLQIIVLDYIYSHPQYSELIFYGDSCLSHCFGLSRLSEDLDFIDINKNIDIKKLSLDIRNYFEKNTDLKLKTSIQKFRIYLKFPILKELNLASQNESDLLFLKIEIFKEFNFCSRFQIQIIPVMKFNKTILIKTFDLSTLMSTKIMAILHRKWEKTDKKGKTLVKVKGRDYFDLMWYLSKNITPNPDCIKGIKNQKELKEELIKIIESIDTRSIYLDLEQFIEDEKFIKNLTRNIKEILLNEVKNKL